MGAIVESGRSVMPQRACWRHEVVSAPPPTTRRSGLTYPMGLGGFGPKLSSGRPRRRGVPVTRRVASKKNRRSANHARVR